MLKLPTILQLVYFMKRSVLDFLKQHLKRSSLQKEAAQRLFKGIVDKDLRLMQEALNQGAKLEAKGKTGRPLEFALKTQFKEGVLLLLDQGAILRDEYITYFLRFGRVKPDFFLEVGLKFVQKGWQMDDSATLRIICHFYPAMVEQWRAERGRVLDEKGMLELKEQLKETLPISLESESKSPKARL